VKIKSKERIINGIYTCGIFNYYRRSRWYHLWNDRRWWMLYHDTGTIFCSASMGFNIDIAIKVAFATNLVVVAPTALSSAIVHNKKGVVLWEQGIYLGISAGISAIIGATIAT